MLRGGGRQARVSDGGEAAASVPGCRGYRTGNLCYSYLPGSEQCEVQAGEESEARRFAARVPERGRGGGQDRGGGGGVGSSTTLPKSYRGNLSPGPPRILSLSKGGAGSRGRAAPH